MLDVFLLSGFTRLGHERQDLFSPCDGMHVCTDQTLLYTLIRKSFGGRESEPMFSGRGDFSLGVNMGSNSIPPKTPSDESINQGLVCAYMHFIAQTQKILTFMS